MHLEQYEHEGDAFLHRIMTVDETWIRSYTPELKRQSSEWRHTESPCPKRCRTLQDPSKLMIMVHTVPHGIRVNAY